MPDLSHIKGYKREARERARLAQHQQAPQTTRPITLNRKGNLVIGRHNKITLGIYNRYKNREVEMQKS